MQKKVMQSVLKNVSVTVKVVCFKSKNSIFTRPVGIPFDEVHVPEQPCQSPMRADKWNLTSPESIIMNVRHPVFPKMNSMFFDNFLCFST